MSGATSRPRKARASRLGAVLLLASAATSSIACDTPGTCNDQPSGTRDIGAPGVTCTIECDTADDCREDEVCTTTIDDYLHCTQRCSYSSPIGDAFFCDCSCQGGGDEGVCGDGFLESTTCQADRPDVDLGRIRVTEPSPGRLHVVGDAAVYAFAGDVRLVEITNLGNASEDFQVAVGELQESSPRRWSFDVEIAGTLSDHLRVRVYRDDEGQFAAVGRHDYGRRQCSRPIDVIADGARADGAVVPALGHACLRVTPEAEADVLAEGSYGGGTGTLSLANSCLDPLSIEIVLLDPAGWGASGPLQLAPGEAEIWTIATDGTGSASNLARIHATSVSATEALEGWTAVSLGTFLAR